jgi:DNA invertase Pin-like site-specific DNA recombinase
MQAAQPLVISYWRFSHPDQATGDSVSRQTELSEKWAAERGWRIDESISDPGLSAFRGKNAAEGALSVFLNLVKKARIPRGTYLLVENLDRLSRNDIRKALRLFLDIIDAGIVLVTLQDGYEYSEDKCEMHDLMYP